MMKPNTDQQNKIDQFEKDLKALSDEYYANNFSASQDFNKYSRFNSRLKVPHYASDPVYGEVGEIIEVGGKLKICTTASPTAAVYTVVGTQT
jgi:hypothetical protein